jgi:hypothetical protein
MKVSGCRERSSSPSRQAPRMSIRLLLLITDGGAGGVDESQVLLSFRHARSIGSSTFCDCEIIPGLPTLKPLPYRHLQYCNGRDPRSPLDFSPRQFI